MRPTTSPDLWGDAARGNVGCMSDLQCPARFLILSEPNPSLADVLRHERVAAVYDGPPGSGAAALGDALALPVQVMTRRLTLADVLAEDPDAVGDLRDLADLHRGETVVVVAEGVPGQRVDVSIDGDGVAVREVSPGVAR